MEVSNNGSVPDFQEFVRLFFERFNYTEWSTTTEAIHDISICVYRRLIVNCIIFFFAFPGICFALYKLCSQVTPDQAAPVYVINLFISDLVQICIHPIVDIVCLVCHGKDCVAIVVLLLIDLYSLQVNVLFMTCISAERYIMTAHAIWYRKIQKRRTSIIVSVLMWILSAALLIQTFKFRYGIVAGLLIPYPLVMFFFVATWRALSRTSVPRNDQIRIRSILGLILLIYTILFLPAVITMIDSSIYMSCVPEILLAFNPLFDLLLYVFLRRDVKDDFKAFLSCFKKSEVNSGVTAITVEDM